MNVLIAPDSFKGSLTAEQAAEAIAKGIRRVEPEAGLDLLPIADGGEGTTDVLLFAVDGRKIPLKVTGPHGESVDLFYGLLKDGKTAVVEAAAACGLTQVAVERRDPRITTSRGLGELLMAALNEKPERILIGIGGSATNDGGSGMLRALGVEIFDENGAPLPDGGAALSRAAHIDLSGWKWPEDGPELLVASDVTNPLCGDRGASVVFGPQKGATSEMVEELDAALSHFSRLTHQVIGYDFSDSPGAGAAGGIGFALLAYLSGTLKPGVEIVMEATRFHERAANADLIVTGEGRLDAQTGMGKAVLGVARAGRSLGKPVVALAGSLKGDLSPLYAEGLSAAMSITAGPALLDELVNHAAELLADAAERMMYWVRLNNTLENS